MTRSEIFNTAGDRSSAQNKVIMITDGESNREELLTIDEAEAAREQDIEIYVVGIGEEFNYREANDITGDKDRIVKVEEFSDLTTDVTVQQIMEAMCGK